MLHGEQWQLPLKCGGTLDRNRQSGIAKSNPKPPSSQKETRQFQCCAITPLSDPPSATPTSLAGPKEGHGA